MMTMTEDRQFINDTAMAQRVIYRLTGERLAALAKESGWTNQEAKRLMVDYLRSLTRGTGEVPPGLASTIVKVVREKFYEATLENRVSWGLLPGMQQGWYRQLTLPRFATQGGGIAVYDMMGNLVWDEPPEWSDYKTGSLVPRDWGTTGPI